MVRSADLAGTFCGDKDTPIPDDRGPIWNRGRWLEQSFLDAMQVVPIDNLWWPRSIRV